jgi:ADP-heptose:LPS heptosyltransferase
MKPICLNLAECNGIGDLISATPTIRHLFECYEQKITVLSKLPELFKNNPCVAESYKESSVNMDYFNENYVIHNSFYNVGKKNELGIEYKHNRIDIRQFHAINLGFTLTTEEMQCEYYPTESLQFELPKKKYVVIHPVQNWASRTWSALNWMLLTQELNKMGIAVISIGKDSGEKGFFNVEKPVFNFEIEDGMNLMNKTSISDCYHIINHAMAVVTMDSGILHIAGCTDTWIIQLGSSIDPIFRTPYRNGSQSYKYDYVFGSCRINCASNMKYGIKQWGDIQGVPPLVSCLENKETFECHPTVEDVLETINIIKNSII